MLYEIYQYQKIIDSLEERINKSKFKKAYLIEVLGISKATFYNKIRNKSFSTSELIQLGKLLAPEEAQALEIKTALQRSEADFEAGNVQDHTTVMRDAYRKLKQ